MRAFERQSNKFIFGFSISAKLIEPYVCRFFVDHVSGTRHHGIRRQIKNRKSLGMLHSVVRRMLIWPFMHCRPGARIKFLIHCLAELRLSKSREFSAKTNIKRHVCRSGYGQASEPIIYAARITKEMPVQNNTYYQADAAWISDPLCERMCRRFHDSCIQFIVMRGAPVDTIANDITFDLPKRYVFYATKATQINRLAFHSNRCREPFKTVLCSQNQKQKLKTKKQKKKKKTLNIFSILLLFLFSSKTMWNKTHRQKQTDGARCPSHDKSDRWGRLRQTLVMMHRASVVPIDDMFEHRD